MEAMIITSGLAYAVAAGLIIAVSLIVLPRDKKPRTGGDDTDNN